MHLITDSLGLHRICILKRNSLKEDLLFGFKYFLNMKFKWYDSAIYCNACFPQLVRTNVVDLLLTCSDGNIR